MSPFRAEDASPEEIARQADLYGPFTQAVRDLVDASLRTLVDGDDIRQAQAEVEAITRRLRERQIEGGLGISFAPDGTARGWGNAVVGLRNAIAPPLSIAIDRSGRATSDFHLGAAYEGPPGLVHGGVVSMILDQVLGHAAGAGGRPGMTGTLTISYRQGTPLGDLRAEAWIERAEGVKTFARGHIVGPDGVTAEGEGVFILPRWARKLLSEREWARPPEFFE